MMASKGGKDSFVQILLRSRKENLITRLTPVHQHACLPSYRPLHTSSCMLMIVMTMVFDDYGKRFTSRAVRLCKEYKTIALWKF